MTCRPVSLEEVVVATTLDSSSAQKKAASISTVIEFNSTIIHCVTGSTLAAEAAALANVVDLHFSYVS